MSGGFVSWWQHLPSRMDPYIIEIGSFRLGWYGMMYVAAFALAYMLASYRLKREGFGYGTEFVQDFLVWAAFGLLIGARLGYVVFYNPLYYLSHPLEIILPFDTGGGFRYTGISGMSYHGGAIGAAASGIWFLRRRGAGIVEFADFIVPCIPLSYTFGRLGNFINGELYGRRTDVAWGMYFPSDPSGELRHASQLYEGFGEGVLLFALLWGMRRVRALEGMMLPLYLAGYGTVRFAVEFFREPDAHLGFVLMGLSLGQCLSGSMVILGIALAVCFRSMRNQQG